jgi:hypothetical protein
LLGGLVLSWVEYRKYGSRYDAEVLADPLNADSYRNDYSRMRGWAIASLGLGCATAISGAFTAHFWSRQTMTVSVQGYGREGGGFVLGGNF